MSNTSEKSSQRLELAIEAAREAGRITLEYFRRDDLKVERKGDDSPVTIADRQAEQYLRRRISEAFPEDGILGEEFGEQQGASGYRWIVDPIDGTKSFIHGVPLYSTLIGVERDGEPVLGVIVIPALDEAVYAAVGQGAWYLRGQEPPCPARVASTARLSEGLFLTSEVANFYAIERPQVFEQLQAATRLTRTWGDGYGYMMVATGRADVMVDPIMCAWDAAPMLTILEEAGGVFTDWQGRRTIHSGQGIATNSALLSEVLAITRGTTGE
jgi:histidinol phosphatase-like enzyme (inositol monophosphatase family)